MLVEQQPAPPLQHAHSSHSVLAERSPNVERASQATSPAPQYGEFGLLPSAPPHVSRSTIRPPVKTSTGRMYKTLPAKPSGTLDASHSTTSAFQEYTAHPPPAYGYTPIGWDKQMDIPKVAELVLMCGEQIRSRGEDELSVACALLHVLAGLVSPLIFSSMALNLSAHNVASLIHSYLRSPREFFSTETRLADPHDLAAVVKWGLARLGRVYPVPVSSQEQSVGRKGEEETIFVHQRGFLEYDSYVPWAFYERSKEYPETAFSTFLDGLASSSAALLVALFSLLSSTVSYSLQNGMTPSKLGRLFGPLLFGLPEDETFEKTYDAYVRVSNAAEHLLLAYIRDMGAMESLPTRLADHIHQYPTMLSSDPNKLAPGTRGIPITHVRRTVRLYSSDLVRQASELPLAEQSPEWAACCGDVQGVEREPQLSDSYRKLINLRTYKKGNDQDTTEAYTSLADEAWGEFMAEGFSSPNESKLAFDLYETQRKSRREGSSPVHWSQFEQVGFGYKDDGLDSALAFDNGLREEMKRWPEERAELLQRIQKTNKAIPGFPYDTTPFVVCSPSLQGLPDGQWAQKPFSRIDDTFPEVYADYLLSNGWSNRDELTHRSANFVMVQYKSRRTASTVGLQGTGASQATQSHTQAQENRTDAAWFLIEEVVPAQYRKELEAAGRKKNRGRASMRKLSMFKRRKEASNTTADSFFDEVFKPGLGTATKKLGFKDPAAFSPTLRRSDSQSSTIRGKSSVHEEPNMTSSSRLLTSLKSRASKRLRKPGRDEYDEVPPVPPPKSRMQQSQSFGSDDFDTRSLYDPELDAFSPSDKGRGPKGASRDDNWLDVMIRANGFRMAGQHAPTPVDAQPVAGDQHATANADMGRLSVQAPVPKVASPKRKEVSKTELDDTHGQVSISNLSAAGWSREEAPATPTTPKRDSSLNLPKAESLERAVASPSPSPRPAQKSPPSHVEPVKDDSITKSPGARSENKEETQESTSLPYLRQLPPRGTNNNEEREKAREARIEAAKERARELRANLNPVALEDLEKQKRRSPDPGDKPPLSALTPPRKTPENLARRTSPTPSPKPSTTPSKDDPFAKDRFSGRVASITSKFGGTTPKPITPQGTGTTSQTSSPVTPSKKAPLPTSPSVLTSGLAKNGIHETKTAHPPVSDTHDEEPRHSIDSNRVGTDNDSIYPDDAASNFSRDTNPEDEGRSAGRGVASNENGSFTPSLFGNLHQSPAVAGAAAAAAVSNYKVSQPSELARREAEDQAMDIPPHFQTRYQPGMPLSNVEEERESVLSGSNA